MTSLKLALICGGPSKERGISLNSARSVMDHTQAMGIEVIPFFVSTDLQFYSISTHQLYSNTPSDFDFKLQQNTSTLPQDDFIKALKNTDLVFPCIHGEFGEDGTIQKLLEDHDIPFIGVGSECAAQMYHKDRASAFLQTRNIDTIPSLSLVKNAPFDDAAIQEFLDELDTSRVVVKPTAGGSSIGVTVIDNDLDHVKEAAISVSAVTRTDVIIEPFCQGREFTIIILQGQDGHAVPLLPTEIEISYDYGAIFDYRRKYLPTTNTFWHTPARFEKTVMDVIRWRAKMLFEDFGMRDFARIDGWVLDDGKIVFTDFNPISGMEQNSFIFQQASRLGLSHQDVFAHVILSACKRHKIDWQKPNIVSEKNKKLVYVLFGSDTAERHVSVMSGTNVWLKLLSSEIYAPKPFFVSRDHKIYDVPYSLVLNHTVEEIEQNCAQADDIYQSIDAYADNILSHLLLTPSLPGHDIKDYSIDDFIMMAKADNAFVFLGLHGGMGEDGRLQQRFESARLLFNGSGATASKICMNKEETAQHIKAMGNAKIGALPKVIISLETRYEPKDIQAIWDNLQTQFPCSSYIIKPRSDGCSAGIVKLSTRADLEKYLGFINDGASHIPAFIFEGQGDSIIELGGHSDPYLMIEPYIVVDDVMVSNGALKFNVRDGWIEYTVGVLEQGGQYHAFNPSITVAENAVLSVEEKFQGGTGINITPPPIEILPDADLKHLKTAIELSARALDIENYARIDCFYNSKTGETVIIEANSLPALTPSTVIYHQGLAEAEPIKPVQLLETIIGLKSGIIKMPSLSKIAA